MPRADRRAIIVVGTTRRPSVRRTINQAQQYIPPGDIGAEQMRVTAWLQRDDVIGLALPPENWTVWN